MRGGDCVEIQDAATAGAGLARWHSTMVASTWRDRRQAVGACLRLAARAGGLTAARVGTELSTLRTVDTRFQSRQAAHPDRQTNSLQSLSSECCREHDVASCFVRLWVRCCQKRVLNRVPFQLSSAMRNNKVQRNPARVARPGNSNLFTASLPGDNAQRCEVASAAARTPA